MSHTATLLGSLVQLPGAWDPALALLLLVLWLAGRATSR